MSTGPWNKWGKAPFMPRKPVDIRRAEWTYRGINDDCAFSWGGMMQSRPRWR